jgi:cysteine desulfurase
MERIYLDHNATTPLLPAAAAAMARCQAEVCGNPASQHAAGRRARRVLEEARDKIGRLLGADLDRFEADRVIFTSGGTESNHLALFGLAGIGRAGDRPGRAIVSAIEHPSVVGPARWLARHGWQIDWLGALVDGRIDADALPALLRPETRFVSAMLGNNETGVLQPIARLAEHCSAAGVALHVDAAQVVGKAPVDFRALGVDLMTVAAHKFHGPVGIGALVARHGIELTPLMFGGFQQEGLRPGTESVALAAGMHAALDACSRDLIEFAERVGRLRDEYERALTAECPELIVHGAAAERLPHTSSIAFPGVEGQELMVALDLAGICCSTGSACASGSSEASPTLVAMGVEKGLAESSLRFSFGRGTTAAEGAQAACRILEIYKDLRDKKSGRKTPLSPRNAGEKSL